MKNIFKTLSFIVRMIMGFSGLILMMCETPDFLANVKVMWIGFGLFFLAVLPALFKDCDVRNVY